MGCKRLPACAPLPLFGRGLICPGSTVQFMPSPGFVSSAAYFFIAVCIWHTGRFFSQE